MYVINAYQIKYKLGLLMYIKRKILIKNHEIEA